MSFIPIYAYILKHRRSWVSAIYGIMKRTCPSSYRHTEFVVNHALGRMMHSYVLKCIKCYDTLEGTLLS